MGLLNLLSRLLGLRSISARSPHKRRRRRRTAQKIRLVPLRYHQDRVPRHEFDSETVEKLPYRFARVGNAILGSVTGYFDFSNDGNEAQLAELQLPDFHTPEAMADWLKLPVGKLAWLSERFADGSRPESMQKAHYHYHWKAKRSGGRRLIEAPKPLLKQVQRCILTEILNHIPPHENAHGFVRGRSILTNARPHAGKRVLLKIDLENFYASVTYSRVVSIFRRVGYSREAALWLGRLTTSALPPNLPSPDGKPSSLLPYQSRHLPQGAATSPALANLSAFPLDVRLSGMARCFDAVYTRYADDLTFSGSEQLLRALPVFIPLVTGIIRSERFRVNLRKRKVIRNNQRQSVTGVVVNEKPNISRDEYDCLNATLTNCLKHGPASQNHDQHENYAAHLCGRIAYVNQLNPNRGARLLELYHRIEW